jgi:hypothetical protein
VLARIVLLAACSCFAISCSDPVHDQQVTSLGPENPAVSPGPNHRPGQPCLWCHGTEGPAKTVFSIGGTVYAIQGQPTPAAGAQVSIEDSQGAVQRVTANTVGNFYITPSLFQPVFPIGQMKVTRANCSSLSSQMLSVSNREGSCAACHFNPAGPDSPGAIFIQYAALASAPLPPGCM